MDSYSEWRIKRIKAFGYSLVSSFVVERRVVTVAGDEGLWDKVAAALGVSVGVLKEKWATANK